LEHIESIRSYIISKRISIFFSTSAIASNMNCVCTKGLALELGAVVILLELG
jgi:hypothetical protein